MSPRRLPRSRPSRKQSPNPPRLPSTPPVRLISPLSVTDAAVKEIARIALERGTGAQGLGRSLRRLLEGVLFEVEAGVRYVITDRTVRGGEPVKQSMSQPRAPLSYHLLRSFRVSKTVESSGLRRG